MLDENFLYTHAIASCSEVHRVDPDHRSFFQIHQENFNSGSDYIQFYWGNHDSKLDEKSCVGLANHVSEHGFFFKFNFDPVKKAAPELNDYFVILTEREYELFHLTGVLTPNLEHRGNTDSVFIAETAR